jgi:RimJ/RimL family protein N-acetyltransferase
MIQNFIQPLTLYIHEGLRLRKPSQLDWSIALTWYCDSEIMYFSEGISNRFYAMDDIEKMYSYLSKTGELYFIEVFEDDWIPVGDVTLSATNIPIIIGNKKYWGLGIGKEVLKKIIQRAMEIGFKYLLVPDVLVDNLRSQRLFKSVGFIETSKTDRCISYAMRLDTLINLDWL